MAASREVEVRAGRPEDVERIGEIQARSPGAARWAPGDYLAHDFRVAQAGGAVVGFLVTRRVAEGESEILNLAVAPEFRRGGVARRLVEDLLNRHPGEVFLEVRESNREARGFYSAMGFEVSGRRPGYYSDPEEAAVVMNFRSC
jgi:ribosomal-protein-alanine N-acetyltransferase